MKTNDNRSNERSLIILSVAIVVITSVIVGYLLGRAASEEKSVGIQQGSSQASYEIPPSKISAPIGGRLEISKNLLDESLAVKVPDLYSESLSSSRRYSWDNEDPEYELVADRIIPELAFRQSNNWDGWDEGKQMRFSSERSNLSVTTKQANNWKGTKTPYDILKLSEQDTFKWTDSCAEIYSLGWFAPTGGSGPGCEGVPEDFKKCDYAKIYLEVGKRYEINIPRADMEALEKLKRGCDSDGRNT